MEQSIISGLHGLINGFLHLDWRSASMIIVGLVLALVLILLSPDTYSQVYGLPAASAPMPFSQPAIISVPLSFITLVVVSLLTKKNSNAY